MADITPFGDDLLDCFPAARKELERFAKIAHKEFGVTVQYPFITLRWTSAAGHLFQMTMVVTEIDDGAPERVEVPQ